MNRQLVTVPQPWNTLISDLSHQVGATTKSEWPKMTRFQRGKGRVVMRLVRARDATHSAVVVVPGVPAPGETGGLHADLIIALVDRGATGPLIDRFRACPDCSHPLGDHAFAPSANCPDCGAAVTFPRASRPRQIDPKHVRLTLAACIVMGLIACLVPMAGHPIVFLGFLFSITASLPLLALAAMDLRRNRDRSLVTLGLAAIAAGVNVAAVVRALPPID